VPLLDRDAPLDELLHAGFQSALAEGFDDLPVPDLAGLGHRQELETVERVRLLADARAQHLGALLLHLARLGQDRGLLALERRGDLLRALLGLLRLGLHPLERLDHLRVLLGTGELADLPRRLLRGHREADHLSELRLQVRQICHWAPSSDAVREPRG